jgi:uncharacterized membrane protein
MSRLGKVSAYILAFITLGLAVYSLAGIVRDLGGEQCYGFWGSQTSCLDVMFTPIWLVMPVLIPVVVILIICIVLSLIRSNSTSAKPTKKRQ